MRTIVENLPEISCNISQFPELFKELSSHFLDDLIRIVLDYDMDYILVMHRIAWYE